MSPTNKYRWKRRAVAVLLFGVSFGYVEAAVVTYLRPQFFAVRARFMPPGRDLFPLPTLEQMKAAGPGMIQMTETEIVREAATMVMLGAVAAAAGGSFRQWLAFLLLEFGAWDIAFYASLKILIDWPGSLLTWDILFLIPVPWTGPVIAPVTVALTMMGTGFAILRWEADGQPARPRGIHWIGISTGAGLILAAFLWDYRNIMAGGMPNPFHWGLFAVGEGLWLAAVAHALFSESVHKA